MDQNIVLSMPQVTVDHTFRVPFDIEKICGRFVRDHFFQQHREVLQNISDFGLKQDHNIRLNDPASLADFGGALQYLRTEYPGTELAQIGGNSAIAALRGYHLAARDRDPSLPRVRYAGIYTSSLEDFIQTQKTAASNSHTALERVFDKTLCVTTSEKPMTLALEGHHKVIIAYGLGRTLDYIDRGGDFSNYLKNLRARVISGRRERKVLFAFPSIPHPLTMAAKLLDQIGEHFGQHALFFVGSSSFRDGSSLKVDRTAEIWDLILKRADILSMNETELGDLHTVVVGQGTYQDKPLAYKLLELPTEAIKVCHGADGALMDPGPDPGRIVNEKVFGRDPAAFLEESLRLATDGAAYGLASPFGHDATEASVRIFSATVPNRNAERFRAIFLNVLESMPPGLITVHAPVVARAMSALTGVGARFDGLLTAFLMRS